MENEKETLRDAVREDEIMNEAGDERESEAGKPK